MGDLLAFLNIRKEHGNFFLTAACLLPHILYINIPDQFIQRKGEEITEQDQPLKIRVRLAGFP